MRGPVVKSTARNSIRRERGRQQLSVDFLEKLFGWRRLRAAEARVTLCYTGIYDARRSGPVRRLFWGKGGWKAWSEGETTRGEGLGRPSCLP